MIEYRNLVKTLVCAVKAIAWGSASCKSPFNDPANTVAHTAALYKTFQPYELNIFIELVQYALEALDIYTINVPTSSLIGGAGSMPSKINPLVPRTKEEKEVLEHFSGVVSIIIHFLLFQLYIYIYV